MPTRKPTRMPTRKPTRTTTGALAIATIVAMAGGLSACNTFGGGDTSLSRGEQRSLEAVADGAPVVGVMMTADWCGTCKTLEPRVQQAMTDLPYNSLAMIYADYTDRRNPDAQDTLADAGLTSLHKSNGGTTGVVYLLDADTGAILGEIRGAGMSASQIRQEMQSAIAAAS